MSKLILDIETIGKNFDELDSVSQEYLLKFAGTDEEKKEAKEKLALYPVTGEIVAIGMLNPETNKGIVLFQNEGGEYEKREEDGITYEAGTEKEILEKFWMNLRSFGQIITFNGRSFDGPYLHIRSAINKVSPTRNLVPYRYEYREHCDLLDQLTFYGATGRKFSLHMFSKAFGIKSPKEDGVDGLSVQKLYKDGKYVDIARYCLGDLHATKELYEYWEKYLKF